MTANAENAMLKNLPVVRQIRRLMSAGFENSKVRVAYDFDNAHRRLVGFAQALNLHFQIVHNFP